MKTRLHSKEWEGGLPANNFEFLKTEQDIRKKSFAPYHILSLIHSYKIASGLNTGELFIFLMLILVLELYTAYSKCWDWAFLPEHDLCARIIMLLTKLKLYYNIKI